MHDFEWLLVLLAGAVALTAVARHLKLPFPSLLALGGTALALLPNTPEFKLDPQLTLALFVAPVLLDAAYDTSLRDLKRFWVPVMCLVVIAVGITTFAVAWLVHAMVPGMPWAAAIALGAIVSPPDAAAASAILRQLRIPHRMVVILEGESLLNDATALLIYRLAVTAAMGTTFTTASLGPQALAIIGSVLVGFTLAHITVRTLQHITDVSSAIVIQFVTTFGVWILADEIGLSAIVTLVTFAITASRVNLGVTPARMRLPAYAVWETVVFVLNVLAFVLIGLQLGPIFSSLEGAQRTEYLRIAAAVLAIVVLVRIAWIFTYHRAAVIKKRFFGAGSWPGSYVPTVGGSLVVSWCGMRGIVTLAAAYALPEAFPYRELILLCAFCVVVGTLIVQGVTLRPLIHLLGIRDDGAVEKEVHNAQSRLAQIAAEIIDGDKSPTAHLLRDEFVTHHPTRANEASDTARDARNDLRARILATQRQALVRMLETAEIGDDAFHQIEERLDWSEVNVR
ncbi:MAG TPA: sodium:proton antiporter [Steroidobacteraceae bacterium]|jgi:CPA1 family monovalent cation:H+ antiporter|nr:sodium:proton antiporter [Steroidobacteraceae bacterium]